MENQLQEIIRANDENKRRIKELTDIMGAVESGSGAVELALAEDGRLAGGQSPGKSAEVTMSDAAVSVASINSRINEIEREIEELRGRLDFYCVRSFSMYAIKLVSFLNARHFVAFGNVAGPLHSHSWQIQIEVRVPAKNNDLVAFADVMNVIKSSLAQYDNVVLNDIHPFNKVQPTTENIALYFFNLLEDAFSEIGLDLGKLSVWETPTKGIEVENRCTEFDGLAVNSQEGQGVIQAVIGQVAATADVAPPAADLNNEAGTDSSPHIKSEVTPQEIEFSARHRYPPIMYAASIALISLVALGAYYTVLFTAGEARYPWGSDTWGHLFKAEYLYKEILKGNYYPQFTEYWYNGHEPFRYWAPLPYYILALMRAVLGDVFIAGNYYIFFCALFGGLSWLFMSGRMGLLPATMAGAVWVIWIDNVRVAFAEGNLPRVLATALLPLVFFVFLNMLEKRSLAFFILTAAAIHLIVVTHAMIAAIYSLCLAMFAFFLWMFGGCSFKDFIRGIMSLAGGIATAAWWLLPSLTGGITELDPEAVKDLVEFIPAVIAFDPLYRFSNIEKYYWGASVIVALAATFFTFRSRPPWAKSLAVCGIILVLMSLPVMRHLYLTFPFSHLLWPIRFSSFAALAVIGSCLVFNPPGRGQRYLKNSYATGILIAGLIAALFVDSLVSVRLLAYTVDKSSNLTHSAEFLKKTPGWRVATIDLSRMGSAPSYLFSGVAGLEQVFGWAWQGAITSSNIMLLNTGMEKQYYPFLFRSCINLGATDLVVKDDVVEDLVAFREAAARAGYRQEAKIGDISIWSGIDRPYIVIKKPKCLVVGKYAGIYGLQFPEVEMATSQYIDDYPLEYYKKYPVVVFTGAKWKIKKKAEEIVTAYAAAGGRVFIEMAGMPLNVLSKQSEFLGVYGEPVMLREPLKLSGQGRTIQLQPFSEKVPVWNSYVPLMLDEVELEFNYYGNRAPVLGYKMVEGKRIGFIGGNINYHSFLTGDQLALRLVQEAIGMRTDFTAEKVIPLTSYRAGERGYVMAYQWDHDFEAVVPVSFMDGIRVELDGKGLTAKEYENLLQLDLPAGAHEIVIYLEKTAVYWWGAALSVVSTIMVLVGLIYLRKVEGRVK